ncbi:MAG: molybdopterin-binding protein [Nitrososphaerales archaeon]|jgi:molybdenum cofactor synthesis domain-containing protein
MVRVEMLAVGRELLIGRTLNTNAQWIGRRLARKGTLLAEITTVDDDLREISAGLRSCLGRRADFVIVVGGLGPTPDDMTLRGISKGIRRRLRANEEALSMIREHYVRRNMGRIEMTPARRKMATLPIGARPVRNGVGTAPGVRLELEGTTVFCLPGVPSEMKSIFGGFVEPEIVEKLGRLYRKYITLKIEGIYESALAPTIESELRRRPGAYIKSHPRGIREGKSRIELDVAVVNEDRETADESAAQIVREIKSEIEAAGATVVSERGTAPSGRK